MRDFLDWCKPGAEVGLGMVLEITLLGVKNHVFAKLKEKTKTWKKLALLTIFQAFALDSPGS